MSFLLNSLRVFLAELAVYPLAPLAVRQADADGRLPQWARWMETIDALGWGAGNYEPTIKAIYDAKGKEAALIAWLRRNKAYTLRAGLRMPASELEKGKVGSGKFNPPKWGLWAWGLDIGRYWERRWGVSLGRFHVSLRAGWKLAPLLDGVPADYEKSATGLFIGVSVRTDDWSE